MNPEDNQTPPTQTPQQGPAAPATPPEQPQAPQQPPVTTDTTSSPFDTPASTPTPMPGPEPLTVGAAPSTGKKVMIIALILVVLAIAGVLIWLVVAPQ